MAGSKYVYVKRFEMPDSLLPGTFTVVRIDGHGFHRFSTEHSFTRPNDERALKLMDQAAQSVMEEYSDIILAFGQSDEYSFLLRKDTKLHNRRHSKILSLLLSLFTSSYTFYWSKYFHEVELKYPPSFDARIVLYPSAKEVRDYFAWRQVDTHINNLYNTAFWALVQQGGESTTQAHALLKGTQSAQKHELLFSRFGINYNHIDVRFRKGSVLVREVQTHSTPGQSMYLTAATASPGSCDSASDNVPAVGAANVASREIRGVTGRREKVIRSVRVRHDDIVGNTFWEARPELLEG
ncbi:tRNAHis guanylyltransferase [Neolentinus lepideus HHB14362 ss-1]|uniref:tRNA(His) guanylyltransferase n=1 Tax=Neolentinus lepideus HHB14362 ss-1 TaxID=1314782 RepID=A0A165VK01_9AGAM|nr:tRNAHis guanylyltransferase [Neolentinus lepideus HHB14362 ss-1]